MFKGSLPAMVTPFNNGEVDVKGLQESCKLAYRARSHGLVPVGQPAKALH